MTTMDEEFITKELLEDVLRHTHQNSDIRVCEVSVNSVRPKDTDFLSKVLRVSATAMVGDCRTNYKMIFKLELVNKNMSEEVSKQLKLFEKEEMFFTRFVRAVDTGITASNSVQMPVPKLLKHITNNATNCLVLEDLSVRGFKDTTFDDKFDFKQCELALKRIAKFHAMSVVLGKGSVENLKTEYELLFEDNFTSGPFFDNFSYLMNFNTDVYIQVLRRSLKDDAMSRIIDKLESVDRRQLVTDVCRADDTLNVLCHRDLKAGNIQFTYGPNGKEPTECKFIDLQMTTIGSPVLDLVYMIFTCTKASFRRENLEKLLRSYYICFTDVLEGFQILLNNFTYELLAEQFRKKACYGIFSSWSCYPAFSRTTRPLNMVAVRQHDNVYLNELCDRIIKAGDDKEMVEGFIDAVKEGYFYFVQ